MTVEQILSAALAPYGVVVRARRASMHAQAYLGASNRIKGFYVRRNYPSRGVYAQPSPYDISRGHPWPKKAQVEDPEWLAHLVSTLIAELDDNKARREAHQAERLAQV